jgi:hypothetical protein
MRRFVLVLALLFFGCATEANFQTEMKDLVGRSEADLVARLGAPQHIFVAPDQSRLLTYSINETATAAATYQPPPARLTGGLYGGSSGVMSVPSADYSRMPTPGPSAQRPCTVVFLVVGDRVQSWKSQGDNCVAP